MGGLHLVSSTALQVDVPHALQAMSACGARWNKCRHASLAVASVYTKDSCCRRGGELRAVYQGMQTEVEVTGLQSGLTYRFRVTAFNQVPPQTSAVRLSVKLPAATHCASTIATAR